jgi:hypothetical protein
VVWREAGLRVTRFYFCIYILAVVTIGAISLVQMALVAFRKWCPNFESSTVSDARLVEAVNPLERMFIAPRQC